MAKSKVNLVDEGFRVSLVETAFFDGKFEIPHIDYHLIYSPYSPLKDYMNIGGVYV